MAEKLIKIKVFKDTDRTPYAKANVEIGSYPNLSTQTDEKGEAVIIYPYDEGTITIYVNGTTVYNDYVSKIPKILAVEAHWSNW